MNETNETLDLDALVPEPRKILLKGKTYECFPLTIRQLIVVARLETQLMGINSEEEIMPLIYKALQPFIPELEKDNADLSIAQLKEVIRFAQQTSIPATATEAKKETTAKKGGSEEPSPTS